MAPLFSLLPLLAFALSTVVASPHIARHVHNHAQRAVVRSPAPDDLEYDPSVLPAPKRRRSLNKRCSPSHANSTSLAVSPSAPVNVAAAPSLPSSAVSSSVYYATSSLPSSTYVPPPPTSSQAAVPTSVAAPSPTPTPSPSPSPSPSSSSTPPPAQTSSSSSDSSEPSYMTGTQSGQGTYYEVGLGACGVTSTDTQNVVAVSENLFDTYPGYNGVNPNDNPVCGQSITVYYGSSSVGVIVVDRCTGCDTTSLDLSPNAFGVLADLSVGRIDITWNWG